MKRSVLSLAFILFLTITAIFLPAPAYAEEADPLCDWDACVQAFLLENSCPEGVKRADTQFGGV